jgi:hypothetical protein
MDTGTLVISLFTVSAASAIAFAAWQIRRARKAQKEKQ